MKRITFTLEEETIARLKQEAERPNISQSHALREAIQDYYEKTIRLSPANLESTDSTNRNVRE